ncbi:MAG: hypothetical protein PHT59_03550 [Candidatus Omnitrophica bacterium]|nr:hypothetical protein [Candidatus Omnitrophota bacterium]
MKRNTATRLGMVAGVLFGMVLTACGQGAAIEKKELLDNMQKATQSVPRQKSISVQELTMEGLFSMKTEQSSETDFPAKTIHTVSEIKDYAFDPQGFFNAASEAAIAQARKNGATEEQIKKMQDDPLMRAEMEKQMAEVSRKIKSKKTEQYIIGSNVCLKIQDAWYSVHQPYLDKFWEVAEAMRNSPQGANKEELMKEFPKELQDALGSMFSYLRSEEFSNGSFIASVADGQFAGNPAYELDIKDKKLTDALEQTIMAYARQQSGPDVNVNVESFTGRNFVAKDTFLPLGSDVSMTVSIRAKDNPKVMKAALRARETAAYPSEGVRVPPEVAGAKKVKDEAELQKLLMESLSREFGSGQ